MLGFSPRGRKALIAVAMASAMSVCSGIAVAQEAQGNGNSEPLPTAPGAPSTAGLSGGTPNASGTQVLEGQDLPPLYGAERYGEGFDAPDQKAAQDYAEEYENKQRQKKLDMNRRMDQLNDFSGGVSNMPGQPVK